MIFYFRVSLNAGLGHLFRCINIAKELKNKKINSIFILEKSSEKLNKFIKKNVNHVSYIDKNLKLEDEINKIEKLLELSKKKKFFIIDGYNFNLNYQKLIKKKVDKLILISDIPNETYNCDILINPSYINNTKKYKNLVKKNTKIFSGKKYLLINNYTASEMTKLRKKRNNFKKINKILISFGGNTNYKLINLSLNALLLSKLKNIKVFITINKNTKIKIPKKLKSQFKIVLLKQIYNLNRYYKVSDLVLGSCGHSTWERSINLVPSICINLEKNQSLIASLLLKNKAAFVLKTSNYKLFENFIIQKVNSLKQKKNYLYYSYKISCLVQKKPLSNLVNKILKNP